MKKRMLIMLIIVGTLFGIIFSYQAFKAKMTKKYLSSNTAPPVTVSTIQAQTQAWDLQLKAIGSLRAVQGVDVTTEIAGMVRNINFTPGSFVKKGQLLVKLNDDAELAQLQSLKAAANLAKINYERDKAQFAVEAVSKAVLDTDSSNLENANAQVTQQLAIIAKKNIVAPFDGKLGINLINLGQYINPADKIVTLQSLNPIYVDFYIPQQEIKQLSIGQSIYINTDSYPNQTFEGKIKTIDPKIDVSTRNIQVEALVANNKNILLPGMFVKVRVLKGKVNYLTLPITAVTYNPYGETVYIVKENETSQNEKPGQKKLIAKQIPVTVGETRADQVAILKGLQEGDTVVTSGQLKLKNGSTVNINNSILPSNNAVTQTIDE